MKNEAKQRKRDGRSRTYTGALAQLAAENGHGDWAAYERALLAEPDPNPDFRVRLQPPVGEARLISVFLRDILPFHGLDEAQWRTAPSDERVQFIVDYALWTRRKQNDFASYAAEILESNVEHGMTVAHIAQNQAMPAAEGALGAPDFVVELESRATGSKEKIGVMLADLLELHGIERADWDDAGQGEREALVEEAALWEKRSKGDLGSYFTQVLSGMDDGEDQGESPAPR